MSRPFPTNLQNIFSLGAIRRDTLDLYKADGNVLRLSRGKVIRTISGVPTEYSNWIRSIDSYTYGIGSGVDRLTIKGQNVNSLLGFNLASDLRLLDYATGNYGKMYQSKDGSLIEDIPNIFPCVLANCEVDTQNVSFEIIGDLYSLGSLLASRTNSPLCQWTYKNGIECTSTSSLPTCPKTRLACIEREKEWEFGGAEFFEEAQPTPPTGSESGGIGGGYVPDDGGTCFLLPDKVWTPKGEIPLGDLPLGRLKKPLPIYSFDKNSRAIREDEVWEVFEHETVGYFTFEFEHGKLNPTPNHRFRTDWNNWKAAENFKVPLIGKHETSKAFLREWFDSKLLRIKWNSDEKVKVRNLHVRYNNTYFVNRCAVSNRAPDKLVPGDYTYN
jgi:hypothetical protein